MPYLYPGCFGRTESNNGTHIAVKGITLTSFKEIYSRTSCELGNESSCPIKAGISSLAERLFLTALLNGVVHVHVNVERLSFRTAASSGPIVRTLDDT